MLASKQVPHSEKSVELAIPSTVEEICRQSSSLYFQCIQCKTQMQVSVPVNLTDLRCVQCGMDLQPVGLTAAGPVNHALMRRLIGTCYHRVGFAFKVIEAFRRDYDRGKPDEFVIDKPLLALHAANAIVQRGHRSPIPFLAVVALLLLGAATSYIVVLLGAAALFVFIARRRGENDRSWDECCREQRYDPSKVAAKNIQNVKKILRYVDWRKPQNLFFFSGYNPFAFFGASDGAWSLLVDRRKKDDGERAATPIEVDLDQFYHTMIRRLTIVRGQSLAATPVSVTDVMLVDGRRVNPKDRRFVSDSGAPREAVAAAVMDSFRDSDNPDCRVYKRITAYDGRLDIGLSSFVRLRNHGPFTLIESVGTRILPVVSKLCQLYTCDLDSDELMQRENTMTLWKRIPHSYRRAMVFVAGNLIALGLLAFSIQEVPFEGFGISRSLLATVAATIYLMIVSFATFGKLPTMEDTFEPAVNIPFPFSLFTNGNPETKRRLSREHIRCKKEAREWNFGPVRWSIVMVKANRPRTTSSRIAT